MMFIKRCFELPQSYLIPTARPVLLLVVALAWGSLSIGMLRAADDRPNFLIIFADDMGYGDLGCYGGTAAATPALDRLATDGTRFTSFYAQTVCGPSRGALMTGRYPVRIGGGWTTNAEEVTVAEVLSDAGYRTGCIGKWDMSRRRYQEDLVPNSQGFESYFGPLGANDGGKVRLWRDREELEPTTNMGSLTRRYTDEAISFLKESDDRPFFLYLAHTMMHVVIDASPEYRDSTNHGLYADTLAEFDAECGRLLTALDELGLKENTLVLFTSDNGPWSNDVKRQRAKNAKHVTWTEGPHTAWGSAGPLRGAKGSTWEGGVRVPGIVRWPGHVPANKTSHAIVSTLDVLPTFAELARTEIPFERPLDGVPQAKLFLGESVRGNRDLFYFYDGAELQAVRRGPWKMRLPNLKQLRDWTEFDRGSQELELYNLDDDLGESRNVAADFLQVIEELKILTELAP